MNLFLYSPMHLNNLGSTVRSIECFGFKKIFIYDEFSILNKDKDWSKDHRRRFKNFTSGAHVHIELIFVEEPLEFFKSWSGKIIGTIANHPEAILLWDHKFSDTDLVLMGSESVGLNEETLDACDHLISIPQNGKTNSLNVSNASGIVLYEMVRQRSF